MSIKFKLSLMTFLLGLVLALPNANAVTLFSDDFSGGASAWTGVGGTWSIEDGKYKAVTNSAGNSMYSFITASSAWTNYKAEVDISAISGGWRAALIVRATPGNPSGTYNFYQIHTTTESYQGGALLISKIKNVGYEIVSNWVDTRPFPLTTWHKLAIEVQDNHLKFYYNGVLKGDVYDTNSPFLNGQIGLRVWGTDSSSVYFDNVLVTGDAPIPEPATMLLLGCGLIGLAGYGRRRFLKKS